MATPAALHSSAALGAVCALGAAILFSTAGLIVRRIDLSAWDVSFWRSIFLVAAMLPILFWQRHRVVVDAVRAGPALILTALLLSGSFVAFILALGHAPVANVLIMFGATPFVAALGARLYLGEPLHRHTVIAMIVAATGLAASVVGSLKASALVGMALAGIVVLCMATNYVVVRSRRDIGMMPAIALSGVFAALMSLPFATPENLQVEQIGWFLAFTGQLGGGLLLYMASLKRIPAARAALLGLLELVLGPIWVWVFDGEKPDDLTLAGGATVIAAAAVNVWLDSRPRLRLPGPLAKNGT